MMKRLIVVASMSLLAASASHARGVCSTGAYKTCVACCKTEPSITNRPLCTYQCGDYKFIKPKK